jgi:hypothetical protein
LKAVSVECAAGDIGRWIALGIKDLGKLMTQLLNVRVLLPALLICCLTVTAAAQTSQSSEPIVVGNDNESVKGALDLVAQTVGEDNLIILIGRLGGREYSRRLNQQRLQLASHYLSSSRGVPLGRIILAEGERMHGNGRLEVYLSGKLFMIFKFPRNKNFTPEG